MPMILRIALRNLGEHKIKSLIICGLVAFGMFLLVLSSSILESAKMGIEKAFIRSLSGNILVGPVGAKGETPNLFPGSMSFDMSAAPTVPEYERVFEAIKNWKGVATVNPQIFGMIQVSVADTWEFSGGAFAYNQELYNAIFPNNLAFDQGRPLADGEVGFLMSKKNWDDFRSAAIKDFLPAIRERLPKETAGLSDIQVSQKAIDGTFALLATEKEQLDKGTVKIGDSVKLLGFGANMKIKRVPLVGVFHYLAGNTSTDSFNMLDLSSCRYLMSMVVGSTSQVKLDEASTSLLNAELSDDDFFGESSISGTIQENVAVNYEDTANLLGDMEETRALSQPNAGAWHYILLRLKDGENQETTIADLNKWFADQKLNMMAVNWEVAAGQVATLIIAVQIIIFVLILIIAFVSMIIIMNTMVASIIERTGEIGTMRAIGAQKGFIRQVFTAESLILSGVGGLIGLILAGLLILVLSITGLPLGVPLLEMVFGGKILYPILSITSVIIALFVVFIVGLLSSIYPTSLAMRVSPLKAMQS